MEEFDRPAGPDGPSRHGTAVLERRRVVSWLCWFAVLNVVNFLFVSDLLLPEVLLGLIGAALGATAVEAVRAQGLVEFRPDPRWFLGVWRLPVRTVTETAMVFAALWRIVVLRQRVEGRFRAIPFPFDPDPARMSARRALFTLSESFAANTYVVGYDEDSRTMLLHELLPERERREP